jgi:hypothetical protein
MQHISITFPATQIHVSDAARTRRMEDISVTINVNAGSGSLIKGER